MHRPASRSAIFGACALAALLLCVAASHLLWMAVDARSPAFYGDEVGYLRRASRLAEQDRRSLLPGRLGIDQRPQLPIHVFAYLAQPDAAGHYRYRGSRDVLYTRIRYLHLGVLLLILGCLYGQARLLGLGPGAALVAPALLAVQPRFAFYVHAVWADMLRTGLLSVGFVLLLAFLRGRRIAYLVPAGLVSGYAVLARNSFLQFMLLVPAFLAAVAWVQGSGTRPGARTLRAVLPAAVFASALFAVVGPQLYANWQHGHGLRLAHNTWRNIEFGLRGPTPTERETPDAFTWQRAREIYFAYGRDYREREVGARLRALDFVETTPLATILRRQAEKFVFLLTSMPSTFELLLVGNKRWGAGPSAWLAPLVGPSRVLWYGLLSLGLLGLVGVGWRSPGWLLLSIFSLYFLAALFAVGFAARFLIPLMPTLCVLASGAAALLGPWVLDRLGRGRARALGGR